VTAHGAPLAVTSYQLRVTGLANFGHKAYDLIAVHAGRKAGLKGMPSAARAGKLSVGELSAVVATVADNKAAAKLRDEMALEFDRRCRDGGYDGDQVHAWFVKTHGPLGRSSVFRARAALRAVDSRIGECSAQAQAFLQLAEAEGARSIFAGATQRASQLLFQLLFSARPEDITMDDWDKVSKIMGALAKLQKASAETEMIQTRLAAIRKGAKAEVDRATQGGQQALTRDTVYELIDKVMRGEAA